MSESESLILEPSDAPMFEAVAHEVRRPPIGRAVAGALLAAALGATAWALMVIVTDHSFAIAATGLGLVSGQLVLWVSGGWRSVFAAGVAVASVVAALVVGKYAAFAYVIHRDAQQRFGADGGRYFGYLSGHTWNAFHATLGNEFSAFYLLWVGLGAVVAWRITGPARRP